ncbi:MAG: transporter substrate-binding domain-containing protein [Pseudomonadota bacterium]
MLDSYKPFFTTNRLKTTQRLEKYLFSAATDIYSGLRLYRHGSTENLTQPKNESKNQSLPLSTLVNSESKNILAVLANHSYGDAIDREIVKMNKNQLYIFETINPYEQFINLFLSGKVQFIITYPEVMQPFIESDEYHIIELEIAGESQFKFGYVMCNKHEENHRFISELNTALFSLYDSGKFAQIASKHLLPSQAEKLNAVLPSLVE